VFSFREAFVRSLSRVAYYRQTRNGQREDTKFDVEFCERDRGKVRDSRSCIMTRRRKLRLSSTISIIIIGIVMSDNYFRLHSNERCSSATIMAVI